MMMKKTMGMLLAAIMLLSLCACGAEEAAEPQLETTVPAMTEAMPETTAQPETQAPAETAAAAEDTDAASWVYFDEMAKIPTPDSCVAGFTAEGKQEKDSAVMYKFALPSDMEKATEVYTAYQMLLMEKCGLKIQVDESQMVYVFDGEQMVAALKAGQESEDSIFMIISFHKG